MPMTAANRKVLYALALSAGLHGAAGELVGATVGAPQFGGMSGSTGFTEQAIMARLERGETATGPDMSQPKTALAAAEEKEIEPVESNARHGAGTNARAAFGAVATPYYHSASELEQGPRPLTAIALDEAVRELAEGYLILRLLINEAGKVDDIVVVLNDAPPEFERVARAAFGNALYAPGTKNGHPVKSEMMIEVKVDSSPL